MKYIVILGDGMADRPVAALDGCTPLEYAVTPTMDALASVGEMGLVYTVPPGMAAGSDIANLAVLGYDPSRCYTGRAPLEALSIGVPMEPGDAVYRCNFVTLSESGPYAEKILLDHSAGELETVDAAALMDAVRAEFSTDAITFYTGTRYRGVMRWRNGRILEGKPPHNHLGAVIGPLLPQEMRLREIMARSFTILNDHPLNAQRAAAGKNKANSIWLWGAGRKPELDNFYKKTGLNGGMISAVDLLKGIAVGAGLGVVEVPGATGTLDTNYEGKADAAVRALLEACRDFAYIHVEAPDEMSHQGSAVNKVRAIEYLDSRLIARVQSAMDASGEDYRLLILPDHPTPVELRAHTAEPVPYLIYDSRRQRRRIARYSEREAAAAGTVMESGRGLLAYFLNGGK